jgi:hypothetical protein
MVDDGEHRPRRQAGESLGYHELWTFQRLLSAVDDSWGEVYRSVTDPLVTLGYAAALTAGSGSVRRW